MLTLIEDALENFLNDDDGQAVVMLNLLRFQEGGGRERYADSLAAATPIVARFGAKTVYAGKALPALSAEPAQAWDAVVSVRYPNSGHSPIWRWMPATGTRWDRCVRRR